MADDQDAGSAGDLPPLVTHKAGGSGSLSIAEAARSYADWHNKLAAGADPNAQPEAAEQAPAADQSVEETDATSPGREPNRETDDKPDLEETPPLIEPPPSWTDEPRQHWNKLDPATQAYLVEYDKKTSAAVSRAQHEAADQLKGLQAREQSMEQARLQYEQLAAASLQALQQQLAGEFGDIRTDADVSKLAAEDPSRYLRWDAHQKRLAAQIATVQQAQARQTQEQREHFARYAAEADKRFIASNPEFADPEKAAKIQAVAISVLRDKGFSEEELGQHWNGQLMLSMRDDRVQSVFADAARYRMGQQALKKVAAKPLPPVIRPGVAPERNADLDTRIQTATRQLDRASGRNAIEIAVQLNALRREAAARG